MNILLILLFFCIAFIFSMLGLGGGILYVPVLLSVGVDFHQAVPTSLAIMAIMSLTAAFIYFKEKLIDWHIFFLMEPFTILGAFLGSYNSKIFSVRFLEILFAIIMFISAFLHFFPQKINAEKPEKSLGIIHKRHKDGYYSINLWLGIPVSFFAGIISSIIGIGGGFAKVPLMTLIFKTPIKIASATSSAMIVLTSLTGLLGHSLIGNVNWKLVMPLSVAVFSGAIIGSKTAVKADRYFLNILLSVLQIVIGIWLIFK